MKLNEVLRVTNHENCILSAKELNVLQELVVILQPFAEATDLTQSESAVSISCVVPVVLSLSKFLSEQATAVRYHGSFVAELLKQMHNRFHHLYVLLNIPCQLTVDAKPLMFNDKIFLLAPAIDPRYAFHWLIDHPGLQETKDSLRHNITGLCIGLCLIFYTFFLIFSRKFHKYICYCCCQTWQAADRKGIRLLRVLRETMKDSKLHTPPGTVSFPTE